jgi:hypothetical protein
LSLKKIPLFAKKYHLFHKTSKKLVYLFAYFKKKQYLWRIFIMGLLCPHENTLITRINLDIMNPFVRTNHTTHSLLQFSKMVAVLLLIFMPMLALANPTSPNSGSKKTTPIAGKQSYHAEPVSYQMYNTSAYKVSTTYNPAQTVYTPFSNETPSSYPSRISGRRNGGEEDATDGDIIIEGEHTGTADPDQKPESPLGDAWSLLFFAAMAAGVITLRKKQAA